MTTATATKALIYMTARDCELYVADALASLARQDHDALHVLFIDDASSDDTGRIARHHLADLFPGRHTAIRNDSAWGKARNAHIHLREHATRADFVAVLDGDDQLITPDIVSRMAARYAAGQDVVWTNYETDRGAHGRNGPLDPALSPRQQGWKTSHFFSFRAELLANIDESYFRRESGDWMPAACDFALAFPILDQTRRYDFIADRAYRYTSTNPRSHHNADPAAQGLNSTIQMVCAREVLSKPPLPCTRPAMTPVAATQAAVPAQPAGPASIPTTSANAWSLAAAQRLVTECPALLDLLGTPDVAAFDPLQVWALHRRMATLRTAPRVLEVGQGPWAPLLALLTRHRQGHFWSIGLGTARCEALADQLRRASCIEGVALGTTALASGEVMGLAGRFPDLQLLGDEADFDLVFVSAEFAVENAASALQALPAVSNRLCNGGFAFVLQTTSRGLQRIAIDTWRKLADDIEYLEAGCAGLGLLVNGSC